MAYKDHTELSYIEALLACCRRVVVRTSISIYLNCAHDFINGLANYCRGANTRQQVMEGSLNELDDDFFSLTKLPSFEAEFAP